jgi:hypothetical protein
LPKKENMVIIAAIQWWKSKKPRGWTYEQHMSNPTVNCEKTKEEKELAKSIARFLERAPNAKQLVRQNV